MLARNPVQIWSEWIAKASRRRSERPFASSVDSFPVSDDPANPPQQGVSTAQEFPSLDLVGSWTEERPTISQIMAESSFQDSVTPGDQSGGRPEVWRSPDAGI
jgi:hypothetical protein